MGDVVGEVAFHFFQRLLAQEGADEEAERKPQDNQYQRRGGEDACHLGEHDAFDRL